MPDESAYAREHEEPTMKFFIETACHSAGIRGGP
jgi:hypothetical protein